MKYVEYTKYVIQIDNLKQWQVDNLGCGHGGMRRGSCSVAVDMLWRFTAYKLELNFSGNE